jgi:hypothetical protein
MNDYPSEKSPSSPAKSNRVERQFRGHPNLAASVKLSNLKIDPTLPPEQVLEAQLSAPEMNTIDKLIIKTRYNRKNKAESRRSLRE